MTGFPILLSSYEHKLGIWVLGMAVKGGLMTR